MAPPLPLAFAAAAVGGAGGIREDGRRLAPLLLVALVTAVAEAGVSLLLLLHLQKEFGLEV